MQEDLLQVAARVAACFVAVPPKEPSPVDVERLRHSVYAEKRKWRAQALASYVIHREQARRKGRGAAE